MISDHLRLWRPELPEEVRFAGRDFVGLGIAVPRRTALQDIADVDILTLQSHGHNDLRQELARPPHEGPPLLVFIGTRRLADKDEIGMRISFPEDKVLSPFSQGTAMAALHLFADSGQPVRRSSGTA